MRLRSTFAVALVLTLTTLAHAGERPNVLFIAVDDLRPELGAYGIKEVKSPNIDQLAKTGMVFDKAFVQQAVCSPSRSSLMTGARPDTTKVWDLVTHFRTAMPEVVTLGQHFKQNGYFVQGMGKIYHGGFDDAPTWSVPWQTPKAPKYASDMANAGQASDAEEDPDGDASKTKGGAKAKSKVRGPVLEGADVPDDTFTDGKVADLAIQTLGQLGAKKSRFFWQWAWSAPICLSWRPKSTGICTTRPRLLWRPTATRPKTRPTMRSATWSPVASCACTRTSPRAICPTIWPAASNMAITPR